MADDKAQVAQIVCDFSLDDMFASLHEKALKTTKSKFSNFEIANSAIEGSKGKYKLVSAGEHVITVAAKEGLITKEEAKPVLQTYVQWFVGPDVKSELKDEAIYALETDSQASADANSNGETAKSSDSSSQKESVSISTFAQYLAETAFLKEESEDATDSTADNVVDGEEHVDKGTAEKSNDKPQEQPEEAPKANGWYVAYNLEIKGARKTTKLKDTLSFLVNSSKSVLKNLLGPITFTFRSWSDSGTTHSLSDLGKGLDDIKNGLAGVFGKIDSAKLKANFDRELKKKFPKANIMTEYFDKMTLNKHLSKSIDSKGKAKVNNADYSFCIKVPHDDLSQKAITPSILAGLVTTSIQGIFKKFKNKVSPNDVIIVNNYNDDGATKKVNLRKESTHIQKTLLEAVDLERRNEADPDQVAALQEKLQSIASSKLGSDFKVAKVDTAKSILAALADAGISDNSLKSSLSEAEHAFMIETEEADEDGSRQNVNSSIHSSKTAFQQLFETALFKTKDIDIVRSIFESLIAEFGDSFEKSIAIKKTALNDLNAYVTDFVAAKNESRNANSNSYAKILFEDIFSEDSIISEKSKKQKAAKKKDFYRQLSKKHIKDDSDISNAENHANSDSKPDADSMTVKKHSVFYAIPDENGLAYINSNKEDVDADSNSTQEKTSASKDDNSSKHEKDSSSRKSAALASPVTVMFGYKDPKNVKSFIVVDRQTIKHIDELQYPSLPVDDNGNMAKKWDPSEKDFKTDPNAYIGNQKYTRRDRNGKPYTAITAIYGNVITTDNGKYDYYVIPMKGIKMSDES